MCRRLLWLCLFLAPLASGQAPPSPEDLKNINTAIAKVQKELAGTRTERSSVSTDIETAEKSIVELKQQLAAVATRITTAQARLDSLQKQQQQLQQSRREQQGLIASYLKSAWIAGNESSLKLLLNQQDPLQSARMLRYYQYFNTARAERIAAYSATLAQLQQVSTDIAATTTSLQLEQGQLTQQQSALTASAQQRQQALAKLDAVLNKRDEELQVLQQQKVQIELLLEELRKSIADISLGTDQEPFAKRKGQLQWPLDGRLLNSFGDRHNLGDLNWEGITIAAKAGADVHAIHHGRVVFADWFNNSGLLLIIDHGDGYMSLYAHNQELYKTVGEWVAAGEVVAAAGNTGGQSSNALYFEIRRNGKAENPVNWLTRR